MTTSHDTPPTPDALAQVLTPEELETVVRLDRSRQRNCIYRQERVLLETIERLAGEVARLRAFASFGALRASRRT